MPSKCTVCDGKGYEWGGMGRYDCHHCHGTGIEPGSQSESRDNKPPVQSQDNRPPVQIHIAQSVQPAQLPQSPPNQMVQNQSPEPTFPIGLICPACKSINLEVMNKKKKEMPKECKCGQKLKQKEPYFAFNIKGNYQLRCPRCHNFCEINVVKCPHCSQKIKL